MSFKKESDLVFFQHKHSSHQAMFEFKRSAQFLDQKGDLRDFYHVKPNDLQKRRRKLLRQGIEPDQTERALRHFGLPLSIS